MHVGTGSTQQKVRKVTSGLAVAAVESCAKKEIAVGDVGEIFFELIEVILAAHFEGVRPDQTAKVVYDLINVVNQLVGTAGHTDDVVVEVNLRHALDAWRPYEDARCATRTRRETQAAELDTGTALRPVQLRIQPEVPNPELVHRGCAQRLGHPDVDILCNAVSIHAESRIQGSVSGPVGVDSVVVIEVVVGADQTCRRVGIQSRTEFIVFQIDAVSGR